MKVLNTSIKHIILLTRVSCSKQDVEESTEQQLTTCRKYIKNLGINKFKAYTLEESSSRGNRKEFLQMINDIKTCDGCTALVFTKVDRLLRRFNEVPELDKLRQQGKIQLHAVKDNLLLTKTSAASDIHRFRLLAADAERFSNRISEKTREKILICCQHGRHPGHAPLGYVNGRSEYGLPWIYPDIQKAFGVAEIFKKFAEGNSLKQLVVWCHKAGLTSVNNKPLYAKAIKRILQNPFYKGKFRHNGKLYTHYYERLVEKDVWEKCQIRLKHYRKNKG